MLDEIKKLVYNEGYLAYADNVVCIDNPYDGVNAMLAQIWYDAWWDAFYETPDSVTKLHDQHA